MPPRMRRAQMLLPFSSVDVSYYFFMIYYMLLLFSLFSLPAALRCRFRLVAMSSLHAWIFLAFLSSRHDAAARYGVRALLSRFSYFF